MKLKSNECVLIIIRVYLQNGPKAQLPVLFQTVARSNLNVPIILFGRRTLLLWNTLNNTEQWSMKLNERETT